MIFDRDLYRRETGVENTTDVNLLEHLMRHQSVMGTELPEDRMLERFSNDLWKLAQEGGLTMRDGNPTNSDLNEVSKALIAFAMQKYYKETDAIPDYKQDLFIGETGGIRFDMADVAPNLNDAKGYENFKHYLEQVSFAANDRQLIETQLPALRDWYVQAGGSGMETRTP